MCELVCPGWVVQVLYLYSVARDRFVKGQFINVLTHYKVQSISKPLVQAWIQRAHPVELEQP